MYAVLSIAATAIVRAQLTKAVNGAGAHIVGTPTLEISLLHASLDLSGLVMEPDGPARGPHHSVSGRLDTLRVSGISLWGLLRGRVRATHLLARTRDLRIAVVKDTIIQESPSDGEGPTAFGIGELDLRMAHSHLRFVSGDTTEADMALFAYTGAGASLARKGVAPWLVHLPGKRSVRIDSLHAHMGGEQHVGLAGFRLDQGAGRCELISASFGPDTALETYATLQDLERDVAAADFPRIVFTGVHIPEHLEEQNWSAALIDVDSADIRIYRDKTRPDGPDTYMPLIARLLRKLPTGAGVDSIRVHNSAIVYNERATRERGFGRVAFRGMNALATGARNLREDSALCTVKATCTAFDRAPLDFTFSTRVQDTTDRFTVVARIGRMPFRDMNVAFGPLADLQAVSGTLDTVILRLDADDRLSRGRVRLAYRDLRMVQGDVASNKARTKPLSVLMNALIPNDKEEGDLAATDEVYTLSRRRNRSLFNYLWINLREGSKKVVLPGFLEK